MRVLCLHAGEELLAGPMEVAREVVAAPELTALPTTGARVAGVFNLRGETVPVCDTAMLLGLGALPSLAYPAVVETGRGPPGPAATAPGESAGPGEPTGATRA